MRQAGTPIWFRLSQLKSTRHALLRCDEKSSGGECFISRIDSFPSRCFEKVTRYFELYAILASHECHFFQPA